MSSGSTPTVSLHPGPADLGHHALLGVEVTRAVAVLMALPRLDRSALRAPCSPGTWLCPCTVLPRSGAPQPRSCPRHMPRVIWTRPQGEGARQSLPEAGGRGESHTPLPSVPADLGGPGLGGSLHLVGEGACWPTPKL